MNAGLQHEPARTPYVTGASPQSSRRRSAVLMNLQINDPSLPAPGEMVSEQSGLRTARSLGELHQELEAEQEAHVNRLLHMIRQQQVELQRLQAGQPPSQNSAVDDTVSDRSGHGTPQASTSQINIPSVPSGSSYPRSAGHRHPRSSFDMAHADIQQRRSTTPSRGASPRLRPTSIGGESGEWVLGGRDESAFYQAEIQMLVRENQMLRMRVRELSEIYSQKKQLTDPSVGSPATHEPPHHPSLIRSSTTAEKEEEKPAEASKDA
ncbi:hypothetical protein B0T10DRAFT_567508 [Thelonectria olida]|uniref:Uncharacterized protein n=1 Tax=Thelonectria olida TaxID=1576542 RepID=A0A9P9AFR6_9HYPO|nr:hypothetical protein B0T10DRAFT_567508 [Thelonectria olida]